MKTQALRKLVSTYTPERCRSRAKEIDVFLSKVSKLTEPVNEWQVEADELIRRSVRLLKHEQRLIEQKLKAND
jgi:hypothetical protein